MSTDRDWERWGEENPYYGVYSDEKFLGKQLDKAAEEDFYQTGRWHIQRLGKRVEKLYGSKKRFKSAVDFGSGAGRLSFALLDVADKVTGLDIAPSMVATAKRHAKSSGIKRAQFVLTDDNLKGLPKKYDLVYSFITLQHVPPRRGINVIRQLADGLDKDGCFAVQITYGLRRTRLRKALLFVRENIAPVRWLANGIKGRPIDMPNMRMHSYPLDVVFETLQNCGIAELNLEFTDHGGFLGVHIIGRKK